MEDKIGKYNLEQEINDSFLSSVYIVTNGNDLDLKYILKKLKTKNLKNEDKNTAIELFNREKEALTQLNHPNIIKYVDSFEEDNQYCLITEYDSDLQTLDKLIDNFSETQKFEIILKILKGFIACHNKKVIHRDIKPSNILISQDGSKVKIIDFGISKIKDSITYKSTMTLRDFKSSPFASPEQKKMQMISEESDIYSLGILIHYVFTNKFLDTKALSTKDEIRNSSLLEQLKPIVTKATNFVREDRYSAVDVLYDAMQKAILKIEEQDQTLKLIYASYIPENLYNLEKIQGINNTYVEKFILDSLKDSKVIFMGNNQMPCLIGDDIKYRIKFLDNNEIVITNVWNLDNISHKHRGSVIGSKIEIFPQNWKYAHRNDSMYIEYLKEKLDNQYKQDQMKNSGKGSMSELLSVWDDYLTRKKYESYLKSNLGRYVEMTYNENSNFLDFKLDKRYDFEPKDKVQLISKNDKQQIVGEFYKYLENDKIRLIASKNFNKDNFHKKGQIGINNYMATRLTNRYSDAMRQLLERTSTNTFLFDILNNPTMANNDGQKFLIEKKYNRKILDSTMITIQEALSAEDIYLVQGPPGTGKTTLISEMISQIYKKHPNKRVLFVSPSHVAVDHALKDIRKNLRKVNADSENLIVRLGKEENISNGSEALQIDRHALKWSENVKKESLVQFEKELKSMSKYSEKEIEDIIDYLGDDTNKDREYVDELIKDDYSSEKKITSILKDWYIDLSQSEQFEQKIIENSFLVCSTCSGIASYDMFNNIEFEWVIIDEAARSTVPELLIPLVRGKKAILVGDHKQLPPIVNLDNSENVSKQVQKSLEESLFKNLYNGLNGKLKTTLDIQFRMNPVISKMINNLYYQNITIQDYFCNNEYLLSSLMKPVTWIDTGNSTDKYETKEDKSFKNYEEVNRIKIILEKIDAFLTENKRKMTVGIISGYEAQKNLLIDTLDINFQYLNIEIDNVDAFQGSEKDIIIYSVVRSNKSSNIGFLKDERRLNVSLSRAKEQLIIVGDSEVANYYPLENNPFTRLLKYIVDDPVNCKFEI